MEDDASQSFVISISYNVICISSILHNYSNDKGFKFFLDFVVNITSVSYIIVSIDYLQILSVRIRLGYLLILFLIVD